MDPISGHIAVSIADIAAITLITPSFEYVKMQRTGQFSAASHETWDEI